MNQIETRVLQELQALQQQEIDALLQEKGIPPAGETSLEQAWFLMVLAKKHLAPAIAFNMRTHWVDRVAAEPLMPAVVESRALQAL